MKRRQSHDTMLCKYDWVSQCDTIQGSYIMFGYANMIAPHRLPCSTQGALILTGFVIYVAYLRKTLYTFLESTWWQNNMV